MVNFDDILKHNVKFGSFQIRTYAIIFISPLLVGCTTFLQVFIAGVGDHWCQIPQWDQRDCDRLVGFKNETCEDILKSLSTPSLPLDDDRDPQCLTYNFTGIDLEQAYSDRNNGLLSSYDVTECNEGMVFDRSVYRSTMTEDWELVCEQSLVPNLLQSLYMAGFLLGCLLFGWLADKIGRLKTFAICNLVAGLCGVSCALAPGVIFYGIFRFITASTTYGSALVAFILATEIATPEMRVFAGVAIWYYYSAAYFVLSAAAKLIPNWRLLLALVSVPYLPLFFCVMFLTESPRWLLTKNKIEETKKAIQKMANVNGNDLSEDVISKLIEENDVTESGTPQGTFVDIIRNPVLFLYFINLAYNWFVQSFLYFGLSLGTSSLGMNVYIAFCISGAVEIPAYTISIFSMKLFGRRASTGVLMILAGISCFATIFAPLGPIRVAVAMVGKFAITASFSNIYIHTAEIFPTPLRALCVGSCSVAARIGGLVAPMILVLRELWEPLPLLLFASSSILAGLLVFFLPETKGKPMPATIQDSVNLGKVGRCDPNADDEPEKDVVV